MNEKQDFTTGSIPKKLAGFMLPILGALILQAMYSTVDMLIVGRFGTTAGISGVSTGCSVINLATFTLAGLITGVTVLIGRYLGEHENQKIGPLIGTTIAFFTAIAAVLTVALIALARPLALLLQAPEEAIDLTVLYIRICGGGIVFVIAYNLISCIFRGLGDSQLPLIFVAIACAVNIVGDLLLVAVFHMNVAGAAIATIAAQAVSVALSLVIIRRRPQPFTLKKSDIRFDGAIIARFMKIGTPLALQEILTQFTFMALLAFINRLGLDASSGYGVAQRIQTFVMLIPSSLMQSMSSFVAQNVGANREDRARKALWTGVSIGAGIGFFVMLLAFFKGDLVSEFFTEDAAVVARSFEFLRGFAPEAIVTSVLFSLMGYFNGHGRSLFVMAQSLAQSFLVRLPVSWIASMQPNASLTWIGMAAPLATCFGIALCLVYYRKMKKEKPMREKIIG